MLAGGGPTAGSGSLDLAQGPIIITETGYIQGAAHETAYTGAYYITQSQPSTSTANTITIQSGAIAMTIQGLHVIAKSAPAIHVQTGATLNLTLAQDNILTGGQGYAAICVAPAYDKHWNYHKDGSAKLHMHGPGSLTATGGAGDADSIGGGAGIGGNGQDIDGNGVDFGSISIDADFSGAIQAIGGAASEKRFGGGAGIGSGGFNMADFPWGNVAGEIHIHAGSICAFSQGNGAGIGGGGGKGDWDTATSDIFIGITGGEIEATGGELGAGIGGGGICDGGDIRIQGGVVTAQAGKPDASLGAAGIGGGNDASVRRVSISGGAKVTATASGGAAGIGGGTNTSYSTVHYGDTDGSLSPDKGGSISITGENTQVRAYGGTGKGFSGDYGGAGIGSGYPTGNNKRSVAFAISIGDHAAVWAYGGYHAQAIGYGYRPTDFIGYGITLTLDDTIFLWAQNADYYQPALVANTDYNSTPIQYDSDGIYLTHYVHEDKHATSATDHTVPGYLTQPSVADAGQSFAWDFDPERGAVSIGPATEVAGVSHLNGNWATLCKEPSITLSLADLIIYVGGAGYTNVAAFGDGSPAKTQSDGLPEPGFTVELPPDLEAAFKQAAGQTDAGPLDLSPYLSLAYADGADTLRTWTLERYDKKEGNTSIAQGRYIYRIVPPSGQDPIQLQFTDAQNRIRTSDDFDIQLNDQYQVYDMTVYPGGLNHQQLHAVLTFPDQSVQKYRLAIAPAKLTIRGVVEEDPTTAIVTTPPTAAVEHITAQVPADTAFFINKSLLEVSTWDAVKLLADHIVPAAEDILLNRALEDFDSRLTEEYRYMFRYLDLVDTSNGNVWVTGDEPVTLYWPYPDGTDEQTTFYLVHFHDLDRQYDAALTEKDYATTLYAADASGEEKTLVNTPYGIQFSVDSFSPFGLFWEGSTPGATPDPPQLPVTPDPPVAPEGPQTPYVPIRLDTPPKTGGSHTAGLGPLLWAASLGCLALWGRKEQFYPKKRP